MAETDNDELVMREIIPKEEEPVEEKRLKPNKAELGPNGRRVNKVGKPKDKKGIDIDKLTSNIDSPDDVIEEILSNPTKLTEMVNTMGKQDDNDTMSKVIRDVTSNPEARKAVEKMLGDKSQAERLRSSMQQRGAKIPKRKDLMRMEKQRKTAMNEARIKERLDTKTVKCLHLTSSRKFKVLDGVVGSQTLSFVNKESYSKLKSYQIGELIVSFLSGTTVSNKLGSRLVKDFLPEGTSLGNDIYFHRSDNSDLTEEYLMKHLSELPKDLKGTEVPLLSKTE